MTKTAKKLILSIVSLGLLSLVGPGNVYATGDCEETYGGGETCIINKSFRIEKKVRKDDGDDWEDKVTGVEEDEVIEFRIRIKNTGELETDDMKMEDFLPDELIRVGGDGLTEEWDNFEPGETKEFIIKVKIDSDEFDRTNFDKCVVNKAEVRYKDKFEGSDTATVCYGQGEISELPETGFDTLTVLTALGLGSMALGIVIRKNAK